MPAKRRSWRRRLRAAITSDAIEVGRHPMTRNGRESAGMLAADASACAAARMLSVPFRAFGIRPSKMNPNTCTICELMFTTVMKARKVTVDATVLFADLRGYTACRKSLSRTPFQDCSTPSMMNARTPFGRMTGCSTRPLETPSWHLQFPHQGGRSCQSCLYAPRARSRNVGRPSAENLARTLGVDGSELGVGIGIHCGELSLANSAGRIAI